MEKGRLFCPHAVPVRSLGRFIVSFASEAVWIWSRLICAVAANAPAPRGCLTSADEVIRLLSFRED